MAGGLQWSDVAKKYTLMFPDKIGDFTSGLLPKNLYNQMPLGKAVIHTYLFFMLYLLLLLLVMLVFSLEGHRAAGFITACVIVAAGTALCGCFRWHSRLCGFILQNFSVRGLWNCTNHICISV